MPASAVGGFAGDPVVGVVEGFADQAHEVPVVEGVNDVAAVFPSVDEPAEAEFCQVLASDRSGHPGGCGELGDGLRALRELPQQVQAGRFGEHPQRAGGRFQQLWAWGYRVDQGRDVRCGAGCAGGLTAQRSAPSLSLL